MPENFRSSQFNVTSTGRAYIHETSPNANMFLERSASFFDSPSSSVARTVMEVIGTRNT